MSTLLVALLGVLLVPLFVATWRTSLLGLACQGFLMAWIASRLAPEPTSLGDWLTLFDLVVVRGLGAPCALYGVLRAQKVAARNDVIPPNLLSWSLALGLVLVAFDFAASMVPVDGDHRMLVAVACSGLLLGFLVLATQSGPFSQIIGVIRIENSIALFELGVTERHGRVELRIGQLVVLILTIALFRGYLASLGRPEAEPEGPTL